MRAIPLTWPGERTAAMVLCRDVSELRRRERELLTKDATIREIHHRVKNNLQTVAALLRLQARRMHLRGRARRRSTEAMRRVATIAMVHETLSSRTRRDRGFRSGGGPDDRARGRAGRDAAPGSRCAAHGCLRRAGRGRDATPLALVLTELVTNAVEHGLAAEGGVVTITALREGTALRTVVRDDGCGLPEGFLPGRDGLGTQIVQALVGGDMQGKITWHSPHTGGTEVVVDVTLRGRTSGSGGRSGNRPG